MKNGRLKLKSQFADIANNFFGCSYNFAEIRQNHIKFKWLIVELWLWELC
jgi:hypothetical protein